MVNKENIGLYCYTRLNRLAKFEPKKRYLKSVWIIYSQNNVAQYYCVRILIYLLLYFIVIFKLVDV